MSLREKVGCPNPTACERQAQVRACVRLCRETAGGTMHSDVCAAIEKLREGG